MRPEKKTFKTITLRLSEKELNMLKEFSENNGVSINGFMKKAIANGFNFKAKNIANHSQFLSAQVRPNQPTIADKVMLQATLEILHIMRGSHPEEVLGRAREFAKNKTNELVGD